MEEYQCAICYVEFEFEDLMRDDGGRSVCIECWQETQGNFDDGFRQS